MKRLIITLIIFFVFYSYSSTLTTDDFDYPVGDNLWLNPPWEGYGNGIAIVGGNLTYSNFITTFYSEAMLQISGGNDSISYRNFTDVPVIEGYVYYSVLINCISLPGTNESLYITSLQQSGSTGPLGRIDPLSLYVQGVGTNNGYIFGIRHTENDVDFTSNIFFTNTTHLLVMKYLFGLWGNAQLYVDPIPGEPEPQNPDADSLLARDADDAPTYDPPDLSVVGFRSLTNIDQGIWQFDSIRIGMNWESVTPKELRVSIQKVSDGIQLNSIGIPNDIYLIQTKTNLISNQDRWKTVALIPSLSDGSIRWMDIRNFSKMFYRISY